MGDILANLRLERHAWARLFVAIFCLSVIVETVALFVSADAHEGHTICYALNGVTDDGQGGENHKTCPVCQTGTCTSKVLMSNFAHAPAIISIRAAEPSASFISAIVRPNPATVLPARGPPHLT